MNDCLEKQRFGKSNVSLSVHLPLRHSLPAFDSTGDDRHCAEGAEGSKLRNLRETWDGVGDGGAESTALHMGITAQLRAAPWTQC